MGSKRNVGESFLTLDMWTQPGSMLVAEILRMHPDLLMEIHMPMRDPAASVTDQDMSRT
jgi:hypothetical protein